MIRSWFPRSVFALTAMLLVGLVGTANAQDKLDRSLREGKKSGQTQRVILRAKPGYEAWARQLLNQKKGSVDSELPSVGGFAVELTAAELELCNSTVFESCSSDAPISASGAGPAGNSSKKQTSTTFGSTGTITVKYFQPAVSTLRATLGVTGDTGGAGVTVAIIDSGIYPSAAFDNRIKAFYEIIDGRIRSTRAFDDYGHGTHVAGLIGAREYLEDAQFQGVAPGVNFVGLKVLDANGQGKTSDVIKAIEFAIANKATFGIDIINLSLGHPIFEPAATDPLVQAVEKASKAGIIVVTSAGNHGVGADGEIGFA